MKDWYLKHKDSDPKNTISRIRNILNEINMLPLEVGWKQNQTDFFSCRLIIEELGFGTGQNGKGITRELALASAYGEILERLQNFMLIKKRYGSMKTIVSKPDSKFFPCTEIISKNKNIIDCLTREEPVESLFRLGESMNCIPYYNVKEDKVDYLPEIILAFTGSNGMCSGNTPPEAITQGICEIFERYSVRNIYENKLNVPSIPIEYFKGKDVYKYLREILASGRMLTIKDCTFGGALPVLAVIIYDKDYSTCLVNFGSNPDLEITLMRCLSEAYQGFDENDLIKKTIRLDLVNNNAECETKKCPDDFQICSFMNEFILSESDFNPDFISAFQECYTDSQNTLDFIIDKLRSRNLDIYVSDVSFLGFPSYHVYIPELSTLYDYYIVKTRLDCSPCITDVLLHLKESSLEEVKKCISSIEKYFENPFYRFSHNPDSLRLIKEHSLLILDSGSDFNNFELDYLLTFLYIRAENYKKSFYHLQKHIINSSC